MSFMWGFLTERDKRDVPCLTCDLENDCAETRKECVAMRNWYYKGDYQDKDIARLRRVMKS